MLFLLFLYALYRYLDTTLYIQRIILCSDFVLVFTHRKSLLFAIFTRYTRTGVSEVYVLNTWSYLRKWLATLTTIATPRYNEGVGMSGDVRRSLGPLFIVIFRLRFRHGLCYDYSYGLRPPCSDSVQLGACRKLFT